MCKKKKSPGWIVNEILAFKNDECVVGGLDETEVGLH